MTERTNLQIAIFGGPLLNLFNYVPVFAKKFYLQVYLPLYPLETESIKIWMNVVWNMSLL